MSGFVTIPALAADPDPGGGAGLVSDVVRIVDSEASSGWFVDAEAYRSIHAALMQSVCRATPEARSWALDRLRSLSESAGDPRVKFAKAGSQIDADVQRALDAERRETALEHAVVSADECPFFVISDPEFEGRQTDRNRFTLSLETGGMLQVRSFEGRWTYGGGGAGRLLPAWGFGGHWTLLAGAEFGGGAMLEQSAHGDFVINYFPALPVIVRLHGVAWHWDLEAAPVSWFQASDTDFSFGARFGVGVGVSGLRTRGVIPWAGAAVAWEHYLPGARSAAEFFRGGLRVGLVWDP